jgi:hypothetical protein
MCRLMLALPSYRKTAAAMPMRANVLMVFMYLQVTQRALRMMQLFVRVATQASNWTARLVWQSRLAQHSNVLFIMCQLILLPQRYRRRSVAIRPAQHTNVLLIMCRLMRDPQLYQTKVVASRLAQHLHALVVIRRLMLAQPSYRKTAAARAILVPVPMVFQYLLVMQRALQMARSFVRVATQASNWKAEVVRKCRLA